MEQDATKLKTVFTAPEYAKFIGIILVVFGHVLRGLVASGIVPDDRFWQAVDKGIYLFHMPLFFFLSGLFIKGNLEKSGARKVILRYSAVLLIPLIVWSYVHFAVQFLASTLTSSGVNHPVTLHEVLWSPFPPKQHFWFLGSLYICIIVTSFLSGFKQHRFLLKILFSALVIALITLPQNISTDFMSAGDWHSLAGQTIKHTPYFLLAVLIGPFVFYKGQISNGVLFLTFTGSVIGYLAVENPPEILRMSSSIICVLSLYRLMCNFAPQGRSVSERFNIPLFIGLNSMVIYLSHVIAAAGTRTILSKSGISDIYVHLGLGTFAGLFMPLLLVPISLKLGGKFPFIPKYIIPAKDKR